MTITTCKRARPQDHCAKRQECHLKRKKKGYWKKNNKNKPQMGPQTTGQIAVNTTIAPAESLDRWRYLAVSLSKHTLIFHFSSQKTGSSPRGSSRILSGEADGSLSEQIANMPLFCLPVVRFPCCLCPLGAGGYWMSRQAENGSEI